MDCKLPDGKNSIWISFTTPAQTRQRSLDGKGAGFVPESPMVEKPVGKGPRDSTALTHLCHLPSTDPDLLLCEMGPVTSIL